MSVYIVTMMKKLVDGGGSVDDSNLYTKVIAINKTHCEETLNEVMNKFEESFLTSQNAKDGFIW